MKGCHSLFVILLLWAGTGLSAPDALRVGFVMHEDGHAGLLQEILKTELPSIEFVATPKRSDVIIALGDVAFQEALVYRRPFIGLMISRDVALDVYERGCACTAVFSEIDPVLQLRLLARLFPSHQRIGVLATAEDQWQINYLSYWARDAGLSLESTVVASDGRVVRQLADLMGSIDALLALPNKTIYNPDTARPILLASYRQNKPVIGPDERFVEAGSVASLYLSIEDLALSAVVALTTYQKSRRLPPPGYADFFSVSINNRVARAFGLGRIDPTALQRELGGQR